MPKKSAKKTTKNVVKKATSKKVPKTTGKGLSFAGLVDSVSRLHSEFLRQATKAVNISLTLRNWLIGLYIAEFEQNGKDRADYGEKLLEELSRRLQALKLDGCERSQLIRCRQFYRCYPQIGATLSHLFPEISATLSHQLQFDNSQGDTTSRTTSEINDDDELPQHSGDELLEKLSYSHIVLLLAVDDPYRRVFYEMECMKGNWSVRELKRQIGSLYFERTALSTNKAKLREIVKKKAEVEEPKLVVRDPMVFEFLGIKPNEAMLEEDVERRMLDRLQETLLELGRGFCFEARQKRLLIGGEHFFVDLVFYHRILKCHVLIELKDDIFRHEHIGRLNTYVSWFKKNMMAKGDNPPIGILLCTGKNQTLVEYALAGMSNNLFVSRYLAELPTQEELLRIAREGVIEDK